MNILNTILEAVPEEAVAAAAKKAGTSQSEAQSVLGAAAPAILGAIGRTAQNDKGSAQKMLASAANAASAGKGSDVLDTLLGSAKDKVLTDVMTKTGVSSNATVAKILEGLLPDLMKGLEKKGITITQLIAIATTIYALKSGKKKAGLGGIAGTILSGALGSMGSKKNSGAAGMLGKALGGFLGKK